MSLILHDPGPSQRADGRGRAACYGRPPGDLRHCPTPGTTRPRASTNQCAENFDAGHKDQSKFTNAAWQALIDAINQLRGVSAERPACRRFVKPDTEAMTTAAGMTWEAHTIPSR